MEDSQDSSSKGYTDKPSRVGLIYPRTPSPTNQTPPLQHFAGPRQSDQKPQPFINRASTPQSANPQAKPTSSPHQQYLDSLQPPSDQDFARMCSLQEDREKEHRHRDNNLRRQEKIAARKSIEARRDFMKSKVLIEEGGMDDAAENHCTRQIPDPPSQVSSTSDNPDGGLASENEGIEILNAKAATVVQRTYRGYRVRREMKGLGLDAGTRWTHAIRDAQWKELTKPRARKDLALNAEVEGENSDSAGRSNARRNWMKVATIARRAGGDEDSDDSVSTDSSASSLDSEPLEPAVQESTWRKRERKQAKRRKNARMMRLQYFLEMVDLKHRYGSNLRTYHEEWKQSDTNENFFFWLDYGEGKNLDLVACPRERLDRECVRYLNREERQHYLVKIDVNGRLVWAKNGIRIDTTEKWKDSIHGIVPVDDPTPAFSPEAESHMRDKPHDSDHPRDSTTSSSDSSRESELEAARAAKYANTDLDKAKGVKKIKHVSAATIFNKLLRKSVRKNTWIFVADTSFRLYVGIKASGAFQHSSFMHGSRISAAGLIKVKNGRLSSLSPLSGHYRPPASSFRAFVHSLEEAGADMSHVSISRSYAVLVGLEMYVKARRKGKDVLRRMSLKKTQVFSPEEAKRMEEEARDKSQSAAKERRFLEKEREMEETKREENNASVKILQKLGIRPRTATSHKDGDSGAEDGIAECSRTL